MTQMVVLRSPKSKEIVCLPKKENVDSNGKVISGCGHDDWEILEIRNGPPPEYSEWRDGQGFVVSEGMRAKAKECIRLDSLTRYELMQEIEAKIAAALNK